MSEKKYQVFISSTYSDLIEERKKLLNILLMADCIPAGMEAFVATDAEQFEVIKKVIDLCDYYILIIGKRYGSVNQKTGISYTEMEYDYAIEKEIPVLVFTIDDSIELPPEKVEHEPDSIKKLVAFKNKAMNNRLASIWRNSEDLTGKLAISIMQAMKEISRPGWQRGVDYDEASFRREIMELEEKNNKLEIDLNNARKEIKSFKAQEDLAFEDKTIIISYDYSYNNGSYIKKSNGSKEVNLSEIFSIIATEMMDVSITERTIETAIKNYIRSSGIVFKNKQQTKIILNQFKALGLVKSHFSKENKLLYWGLTVKGEKNRDDMILIRKEEKE